MTTDKIPPIVPDADAPASPAVGDSGRATESAAPPVAPATTDSLQDQNGDAGSAPATAPTAGPAGIAAAAECPITAPTLVPETGSAGLPAVGAAQKLVPTLPAELAALVSDPLRALFDDVVVLGGVDQAEYVALFVQLAREEAPQNSIELHWVKTAIELILTSRRLRRMTVALLANERPAAIDALMEKIGLFAGPDKSNWVARLDAVDQYYADPAERESFLEALRARGISEEGIDAEAYARLRPVMEGIERQIGALEKRIIALLREIERRHRSPAVAQRIRDAVTREFEERANMRNEFVARIRESYEETRKRSDLEAEERAEKRRTAAASRAAKKDSEPSA